MRKLIGALALAASVLALSAASALADYTLDILHINDLHSRIEPINAYDSTCPPQDDAAGRCFGGVARLKSKIDALRAGKTAGENVILLDAGDQSQGSLFYTTYKGKDALEFMTRIGFDAMALGNHEFDDGPGHLAAFIGQAPFPVISGNVRVAPADPRLAAALKESAVLTRGGQKIGILSVLATDTAITSSPGPNVTFAEEVAYLKDAVSRMEAAGIDKIILLSHVGFARDKQIAAAVDGIDVIIGGHSHTLLSNTVAGAPSYPTLVRNPSGQEVPIVQAGSFGKYLGNLRVVFDDAGRVKTALGDTILIDHTVKPDETVAARVSELARPIEELKRKVVAEAQLPIDGAAQSCRSGECAIGNLVADAMLERGKGQGVTIAIQNGGGLRASIDRGPITMGEVLSVLPFQNSYATFQLSGRDIKASIETGLSQIEEEKGRFPQVAGLRYRFDRSVPPNQGRVKSIETFSQGAWAPLQDDALYTVATNNFMRAGGDGYALFKTKAQNAYDFGPGLEQVLADYLAAHSPYTARIDGRIADVTPR